MVVSTTPKRITPEISAFCEEIAPGEHPVYVFVQPEGDCSIRDCFWNVRRKIERDGGNTQHGWIIWEWPSVSLEAEFHAVWRSPEGAYTDITPKEDGEKRILFLAHHVRVYDYESDGLAPDSIRKALTSDPIVHEYLSVSAQLVALIKRHASGRTSVMPAEEYEELIMSKAELRRQILNSRMRRNDPCFCGSGNKYKRCCILRK